MDLKPATLFVLCLVLAPKLSGTNIASVHAQSGPSTSLIESIYAEVANRLIDSYWAYVLRTSPELATSVGEHQYDDSLSSYSLRSREQTKKTLEAYKLVADSMKHLTPKKSAVHRDLNLLSTVIRYSLDELNSISLYFPISYLNNPQKSLRTLISYMKFNTSEDYWNLIKRIKSMPNQIDEQIYLMRLGIAKNYTLHASSVQVDRSYQNESITEYYIPFLQFPDQVSREERESLQRNASAALMDDLLPAFAKLADFLENDYLPNTRREIGVSSLPGGMQYYGEQLSQQLGVRDVAPQELHDMGLAEVDRIASEMDEVIQSMNLTFTHVQFGDHLRSDESQRFSSEEEAMEVYREMLYDVIPKKLPQLFSYIPKMKLRVEKVPGSLAGDLFAYYMLPSPDGSTPGTFYLDTSDLSSLSRYDVTSLSMHEGLPGHHFQFAFLIESDMHDFKKYGTLSSGYNEGWGMYSEYLGYELQLYDDPYQRYGHLSYEMLRACRLVVDTGMHALGWSQEQAVQYMLEHTANSRSSIESEVRRYIAWPGQACAYKFGELKMKQFRSEAEKNLGSEFDVKKFHNVILTNPGPLELLPDQVALLAQTKQNMANTKS